MFANGKSGAGARPKVFLLAKTIDHTHRGRATHILTQCALCYRAELGRPWLFVVTLIASSGPSTLELFVHVTPAMATKIEGVDAATASRGTERGQEKERGGHVDALELSRRRRLQ